MLVLLDALLVDDRHLGMCRALKDAASVAILLRNARLLLIVIMNL